MVDHFFEQLLIWIKNNFNTISAIKNIDPNLLNAMLGWNWLKRN